MFTQTFIKLSAAVHELSSRQTFLPYLAKCGPVTLSDLEIPSVLSRCQGPCKISWS